MRVKRGSVRIGGSRERSLNVEEFPEVLHARLLKSRPETSTSEVLTICKVSFPHFV